MNGIFTAYVKKAIKQDRILLETWCEKMLQKGSYGIRLERRNGFIVKIELNEEVPYGHIHEHLIP